MAHCSPDPSSLKNVFICKCKKKRPVQCPCDWLVSIACLGLGQGGWINGQGSKKMSGSEPIGGRIEAGLRRICTGNGPSGQWHVTESTGVTVS